MGNMADRSRNLPLTLATAVMVISFGRVAHGQCPTPLANVAVYEGTKNTILSCGRGPSGESWTVRPTSSVSREYPITNYSTTVVSAYAGLYAMNQTGLIIRNATIDLNNGALVSTAGIYYVYALSGSKVAIKLVVIRSGPTCFYTQSATLGTTSITCTIIYADHPVATMDATIGCTADGKVYTSTVTKTLLSTYLYSSVTTITIQNSSNTNYKCQAAFTAPEGSTQYLAKNTPNFTTSVPAVEAPTTTARSTTKAPIQITTGRYSPGSIYRRPVNTAAITGSSSIILECASVFGTSTIRWSFTPFGSLSNESTLISSGYQLLSPNNGQYLLRATANSSVLVVSQLTSLTEGNYSCTDNVETASAILLVIPYPISVEPSYGPIAGGTNVVITGLETLNQLSRNADTYVPDFNGFPNVFFGNELSATSLSPLPDGRSTLGLVATSPNTTVASIAHPLPIIIEFHPTQSNLPSMNMTFNTVFTYLPNPEITGLTPNRFIVSGGIPLYVTGQSLSSVARPIIQLTVFIYRSANGGSTTNTSTSGNCTILTENTYMKCPMPPLDLPTDFLDNLNLLYNDITVKTKRDTRPSGTKAVQSVLGANGVDRADIYLGFILDGYKKYVNINDALPNTKALFFSPPEITPSNQLIEFDPSTNETILVKGRFLLRGVQMSDYIVKIGNEVCTNIDLRDSQLSCRPPAVRPPSTSNDNILCGQHLSITVTLGYKQYAYACLEYTDHPTPISAPISDGSKPNVPLIVGLTVGLVGFAILLIVLIVCIVRYRSKHGSQGTNSDGQEIRNRNHAVYSLYRPNTLFWRKKGGLDTDSTTSDVHDDYYARNPLEFNDNMSANEQYLNGFDAEERDS